jgi:hypothetical protein
LRRDLALRALRAVDHTHLAAADVRKPLVALLRTCPIGNDATVHESVMCAGAAPHLRSTLSPWPARFEREEGLFIECTHPHCDRPTWHALSMVQYEDAVARAKAGHVRRRRRSPPPSRPERAAPPRLPPQCYNGSLEKRRGALYFCEAHCLSVEECSVR